MTSLLESMKALMKVDRRVLLLYVIIYFSWGMMMNEFGKWAGIAQFIYWWQVITCYIFYMIPISLMLRKLPWYDQYAYGLVAMGILEFLGYWLETSIAFPDNLIDQVFNERNFSLGMALFFAAYFPLGNNLANWLSKSFWSNLN